MHWFLARFFHTGRQRSTGHYCPDQIDRAPGGGYHNANSRLATLILQATILQAILDYLRR